MKYNKIRLENVSQVDLPLVGVASPSDKFICKGVEGLGPPENDVSISGGYFQGSTPRPRQVIVRVGLNPDYTTGEVPSDLRDYLYVLLTGGQNKSGVKISVLQGTTELCNTTGARISRMETNQFSKDPEVVITLECLDAYLVHPFDLSISLTGMSLSAPVVTNVGTAPVGFKMRFTLPAGRSYFAISTPGAVETLRFNIATLLGANTSAGDILEFDTRPGLRKALLYRGVSTFNILPSMDDASDWLVLYAGANTFGFDLGPVSGWSEISYLPKYWGV